MFLQLLFSGLSMGAIYALVAAGIILIYNAIGVVNFAQGEFLMLGAFFSYTLLNFHLGYFVSILLSVILTGILGYIFQLVVYRPLKNKHFLTVIVATIGVMILLRELARIVWGPVPRVFPDIFKGKMISVGNAVIQEQVLFIIVVSAILLFALYYLLNKTSVGIQMRAVAQDKITASLVGINADKMIVLTFILSASLGALAGILIAPIFFISTNMGAMVGLYAFTAALIGGFGNITGGIIGALFLGISETFISAYISSTYKPALVFVLLIIFLIIKPEGLFGERVSGRV